MWGRFRTLSILNEPVGPLDVSTENQFGGLSTGVLWTRRIARQLILKTGAAFDSNIETKVLRPHVELAVVFQE